MDVAHIIESTSATWQRIDTALAPVVGTRGVDALYKRSLIFCSREHPWLAGLGGGLASNLDTAALRAALSKQNAADAAAGAHAVFQTFHELLATLVGRPLTERLLASVAKNASISRLVKESPA